MTELLPHEVRPKPEPTTAEAILAWHQKHAWAHVKDYRNQLKASGVTVYSKEWDSDPYSIAAISAEVEYILGGRRRDTEFWIAKDNTQQVLTNEEFLGLATCLKHYFSQIMIYSKQIKEQIYALATVEEVHSFDYKAAALWPSSVYDSIPVSWDVDQIPILVPLLQKISYLEGELEKLKAVSPVVNAANTTLALTPDPRVKSGSYWVYIRLTNTSTPEQDLSLHGVKIVLTLDHDPTTAYKCTWKKRDDGNYVITPNDEKLDKGDRLTLSLKFKNIDAVTVTLVGFA